MGLSDDVLQTFKECSVQQRDCVDSIAFSEAHNAILLLDQSRNTRVQYVGLEPGVDVRGAADIELDARGGEEGIRSMAFNKTGSLLLFTGTHISVVRVDKSLSGRGEARIALKGSVLLKGVPHRVEVVQAAWHPLSPLHVVALVKKGHSCAIHVFGLPEHGDLSQAAVDEQVIPISLQAFPEVQDPDDWRSFAFGPVGSGSCWERFTIYLLHVSGIMFALCPVIPHGCRFSRDAVLELYGMLPVTREDGTYGDPEADIAHDVLQKYFPTFDPYCSRPAGLVESRRPMRQYTDPVLQIVHNFEGSQARRSTQAWRLSLLNPDGSQPILAVSVWDGGQSPADPQCRVEVGVVLHVIHPGFTPGKWSRESQDIKSIATLDFRQWQTSRPPAVLVDPLRLGIVYVTLSDHVFRADLPIVSKVDSYKHLGYGQWRVKEPTVRELRGASGGAGRSDIIGACLTCKLEGGDSSWLYVRRRHAEESFGVDLSEAGPYLVDNLLEVQRTRAQVTQRLTQGPASMLLSANKYTQDLEDKVRAAKGLLGLEREELTAQVVGPRRWLELRMADRIQEIRTAMLVDERGRVDRLRQQLEEQGDLKALKDRATELERELTGSAMKLEAVGKAISSLRTRMTPQERQAKQALEVADKRLQRLSKIWERVRKSVTRPVEGQLDSNATLSDQLSALSLQQRPDDNEAAREEEKVLNEVKEGVSRIDRLLQNLEDRTSAVRQVLDEEEEDESLAVGAYPRAIRYGEASTPSRP